eukprot:2958543-Pyramimonas_sp.AAC.1
MEYWLGRGWTERQIRRRHSLCQCKQDDAGTIVRSKAGQTTSQEHIVKRDLKKGHRRGSKALRRRLLHMPQLCRSQHRLPHQAPVKKPEFQRNAVGLVAWTLRHILSG